MTDTIAGTPTAASRTHRRTPEFPIGDPVPTAWREDVLTRAKELDSLRAYLLDAGPAAADDPWWTAIREHLEAVKQAAEGRRGRRAQFHRLWASVTGSTIGRAMSNLDAAEANLLRVAPDSYLAGQMPSLLNHVQRHLDPGDPRRRELERLAGRLGSDQALAGAAELSAITERERNAVVGSVRAASKAALVETEGQAGPADPDVDDVVKHTAGRADLLVVELIGLTAAAVAAATALRGIRGSSEPYGLPVALATLKLPMGAVTAFLGLLLMRGQFVPGLSALDTSAQILAWALVFGYAQQLFTRFVDQQAHSVLDTVRQKKVAA